jgi:cell division protein FtsZ
MNNRFEVEVMDHQDYAEGAVIKAIGVGGGGGNMINHMVEKKISGIDLIVANTDIQALESSLAPYKIQLGRNLLRGRGCGMIPDRGREAAEESYDEIKEALNGADMVFIAAGLGGGTGTGAAPVVAKAAKEIGALTVGVVTQPFKFEGRKRSRIAEAGLKELKEQCDSIIVIPNEKLLTIVDRRLGVQESFKMVDDILAQAVTGISNVIIEHSPNDINLDFNDVRTVMSHKGLALMGVGKGAGQSSAKDAAQQAISSPLLGDIDIKGAQGVLAHFNVHPNYPIIQISEAMGILEEYADEDANVIFGVTTNDSIPEDEVSLTIVATGFEREREQQYERTLGRPQGHFGRGSSVGSSSVGRSSPQPSSPSVGYGSSSYGSSAGGYGSSSYGSSSYGSSAGGYGSPSRGGSYGSRGGSPYDAPSPSSRYGRHHHQPATPSRHQPVDRGAYDPHATREPSQRRRVRISRDRIPPSYSRSSSQTLRDYDPREDSDYDPAYFRNQRD